MCLAFAYGLEATSKNARKKGITMLNLHMGDEGCFFASVTHPQKYNLNGNLKGSAPRRILHAPVVISEYGGIRNHWSLESASISLGFEA